MARTFAGLILAGGAGARFGGPKAFARLPGGETFLDRCNAALRDAGASPVVATLPAGTATPPIPGLEPLTLSTAGLDMFDSLRIGLGRLLASEWRCVAVLPVDHPLVSAAVVRALAIPDGDAVLPVYRGKHGHPVCLDRRVAEGIAGGGMPGPTLRDVLRLVGTIEVVVDDPGVVANCNTPERLRQALGGMPTADPG